MAVTVVKSLPSDAVKQNDRELAKVGLGKACLTLTEIEYTSESTNSSYVQYKYVGENVDPSYPLTSNEALVGYYPALFSDSSESQYVVWGFAYMLGSYGTTVTAAVSAKTAQMYADYTSSNYIVFEHGSNGKRDRIEVYSVKAELTSYGGTTQSVTFDCNVEFTDIPKDCTINYYTDSSTLYKSVSVSILSTSTVSSFVTSPTKSYYDFGGWYTSSSGGTSVGSSTVASLGISSGGTYTVYAHWTEQTCTLKYYKDGSVYTTKYPWIGSSSTVSSLATSPTKTGYTFDGWYTSASGGTNVSSTTIANRGYSSGGTYYVYAQFSVGNVTLYFKSYDGSTNYTTKTVSTQSTSTFSTTAGGTPSYSGYTFKGWYTASSGGTNITSSTIVSRSYSAGATANIYSQWYTNLTLKFYTKPRGTTSETFYATNNSYAHTSTTYIKNVVTEPSKNGYVFGGWYGDSSFSTSWSDTTIASHSFAEGSTQSVYGKFVPVCTITYMNGSSTYSTKTNIDTASMATISSLVGTYPEPTGKKFKGWYTSSGTLVSSSTIASLGISAGGSYTVYARFDDAFESVTYHIDSSTIKYTKVVKAGTVAENYKGDAPSKTGCYFVGWGTSSSSTQSVSSTQISSYTGYNLNFYAIFKLNTFTLNYHDIDGTVYKTLSQNDVVASDTVITAIRRNYKIPLHSLKAFYMFSSSSSGYTDVDNKRVDEIASSYTSYDVYAKYVDLIIDRTEGDVAELREFKTKILTDGWNSLTTAEKTKYLNGMKGAYNATDLNRVNKAIYGFRYLRGGTWTGTLKMDWTMTDVPTTTDMANYRGALQEIKNNMSIALPSVPDMSKLTVYTANDIENILWISIQSFYN